MERQRVAIRTPIKGGRIAHEKFLCRISEQTKCRKTPLGDLPCHLIQSLSDPEKFICVRCYGNVYVDLEKVS